MAKAGRAFWVQIGLRLASHTLRFTWARSIGTIAGSAAVGGVVFADGRAGFRASQLISQAEQGLSTLHAVVGHHPARRWCTTQMRSGQAAPWLSSRVLHWLPRPAEAPVNSKPSSR